MGRLHCFLPCRRCIPIDVIGSGPALSTPLWRAEPPFATGAEHPIPATHARTAQQGSFVSFQQQNRLDNRLQAAASARQSMQSRFRDRPGADDPAVQARQVERRAIIAAREERALQREVEREARAQRAAQELEAAREAERARIAAEAEAAAERQREAQAQRKEERDARYAARKAKIKLRR